MAVLILNNSGFGIVNIGENVPCETFMAMVRDLSANLGGVWAGSQRKLPEPVELREPRVLVSTMNATTCQRRLFRIRAKALQGPVRDRSVFL